MHTPRPKYFCPKCRASYTTDQNFCGRCGADMKHVSGLQYAALREERRSSQHDEVDPLDPDDSWDETEVDAGASSELPERRSRGRDPWLSRVVDNRYRVIEVIGRGGMGVVYKVQHQRMGKIAAMKVLHNDLAEEPEVVGRFRREAAAVSRLNHPNTVQVFDFGTARGRLYLIMEYVRGLDLGSLVSRDGPLPFDRAAPLFGQICAALDEAHELGVVHRDLKPENILVTRTHAGRDFVKVLDFGLAKLSEREEASSVTDRGSIVGTPYYMSPEQIRGEEEVDARSDLYSLGALMYKVLTGEPAYSAKSPVGVLTKHLTAELVPPSSRVPELEIHPRVDAIVERAMAKKRADRFASAQELLEELEAVYAEVAGGSPSSGMRGLSLSTLGSSSQRSAAASPLADDEIDYGVDSSVRLQRADIDAFERNLKRRRWLGAVVVPVLIAGLAAGAVYMFLLRSEPPRTAEREPNQSVDQATLVRAGEPVTGYLGKRISRLEPDRDYFVVERPGDAGLVTATVTGLPNIDIDLTLYDRTGRLLHQRNEAGVGGAETIRDWRIRTDAVLAVGQRKPDPVSLPVENVSDAYTLTVTFREPSAGVEVEPNDASTDAMELGPGATVTGYLDRREDVDVYRWRGSAGRYQLKIGGASAVPLLWRAGTGDGKTARTAVVELEPGSLLQLSRSDARRPDGEPLPGADEPYVIQLAPAP